MTDLFTGITNEHCGSCSGLCCRKEVWISLNPQEVATLAGGGTKLQGVLLFLLPELQQYVQTQEDYIYAHDSLKQTITSDLERWLTHEGLRSLANVVLNQEPGKRSYRMEIDCAFLDTSSEPPLCSIYDDPSKPSICDTFVAGGNNCNKMRTDATHPVAIELTPRMTT